MTALALHRMHMTPLQPLERNGLKGFGFTISFTDPQPSSSQVTADTPEGTLLPPSGEPIIVMKHEGIQA